MSGKQTENTNIRDYLLGKTSFINEDFEERLMTDDKFFQEFQIQEEELTQDYADNDLSNAEKKQFESYFLISKERKEKLEFAQSLRKNIDHQLIEIKPESKAKAKETRKLSNYFSSFFSSPIPVAVCLVIIVGLTSVLIWNSYSNSSESEFALASLNKAYKKERPLESRISKFDYAPKSNTRGNNVSSVNKIELDRAENLILKYASDNPNAENLHSLGKLFLAKKEFDNAIEQLEKAEKLDAQNAHLQNDLGIAYLEKAAKLEIESGKKLEFNDKALNKFEVAIGIDTTLLEARFNKGLILQVYLDERAKDAWKQYLKFDNASKWADEARRYLQILESNDGAFYSDNDLLNNLLSLFQEKDDTCYFVTIKPK